ncbi:hypothetical protein [Ferrimonas senticii]|uniref:hypothetical protein n=1 Tax=Ferrimonas senticii TaxID=394566 RepID=UPI0004094462|nr:hypothetical protein [Ferrimonas senticii]
MTECYPERRDQQRRSLQERRDQVRFADDVGDRRRQTRRQIDRQPQDHHRQSSDDDN